jgi:hypothetical protein
MQPWHSRAGICRKDPRAGCTDTDRRLALAGRECHELNHAHSRAHFALFRDLDVGLDGGRVIGRIMLQPAGPRGSSLVLDNHRG